jgi:hypothetical protein
MPLKEFLHHGQAVGVEGEITMPIQHVVAGHARCGLPGRKAGRYEAQHPGHTIPGILSYGLCHTEVKAMDADGEGFFRTEVRATVEDLSVLGDSQLRADRIAMGLVSVYGRHWHDRGAPAARVLPFECSFGNLTVNGRPAAEWLPAPFRYSAAQREAYLRGDDADPAMEAEIRQAIAGSAARFVHIPNFGRIFFGVWETGAGGSQHVHRLTMLQLRLGSPVKGTMSFSTGENDGEPPPPKA